jgi:uncharacterized membrane protein YbhN (UPF0104 family)
MSAFTKNILSGILSLLLLLILFQVYSFESFLDTISVLKITDIVIIIACGVIFLFSTGVELYYYYRIYLQKKISLYDTLTLPAVMNLWGHILPFQGSFIYNAVYLKSKYGFSINSNFKVYLFQFFCSISIGAFMLMGFKIHNQTIVGIEYPVYLLIILLPFFYNKSWVLLNTVIIKFLPEKFKFENPHLEEFGYKKILFLILINIIVSLIFSLWLYIIAVLLDYNIQFLQLFIIGILSKIALLLKITPGNLGINQFTFAGIFVLLGLPSSEGVDISLYLSISYFIISFTVGMIFHVVNMKHMKLNQLFK